MLDYIALFLLAFVVLVLFYGVIAIHDIPYEIAKHRNHPHQDAIHVTGWISLFTLHVIWPLLWIWATLYRVDRGWGFGDGKPGVDHVKNLEEQVAQLTARISALEVGAQPNNDHGGEDVAVEKITSADVRDDNEGAQ